MKLTKYNRCIKLDRYMTYNNTYTAHLPKNLSGIQTIMGGLHPFKPPLSFILGYI